MNITLTLCDPHVFCCLTVSQFFSCYLWWRGSCTHIRLHVCTYAYIHTYVNTYIHEHQIDVVWVLIFFSFFFFNPSSVACGGAMVVLSHVCVYLCGWMCLCIHAYTCTRKQIAATQYPFDSLRCNTLQHSSAHCNTLHPMSFTSLCPTNSLRNIPDFRVCTRTYTRKYMDTCIFTYIHTYASHIHTHPHTWDHILYIYTYIYIYVCIRVYTYNTYLYIYSITPNCLVILHEYAYLHVYICIYMCIYI